MWYQRWLTTSTSSTHLLLTGGKISVPDGSHATFLAEYANSIARGERTSFVERRTDVFRLFFDLDMHLDEIPQGAPAPETLLRGAILATCALAREWFVLDDIREDASVATILRKDVEASDKIGVHLVFTDIFTTAEGALAFREHVVSTLVDAVPDAQWNDIFDAAVFKGSGLRLPWAPKAHSQPGIYVPKFEIRGEDLVPVPHPTCAEDYRAWIRTTTIRAPDAVPTAVAAAYYSETCSRSSSSSSIVDVVALRASEYESIVSALNIPHVYEPYRVVHVHRVGEHAVVFRSSSRKCANKWFSEHRSSNVYFVVLRKGVCYQRCYCRKDTTDRTTGKPCSTFASPSWEVSAEAVEALFSDEASIGKGKREEHINPLPEVLLPPSIKKKRSAAGSLQAMLARTRPSLKKGQEHRKFS